MFDRRHCFKACILDQVTLNLTIGKYTSPSKDGSLHEEYSFKLDRKHRRVKSCPTIIASEFEHVQHPKLRSCNAVKQKNKRKSICSCRMFTQSKWSLVRCISAPIGSWTGSVLFSQYRSSVLPFFPEPILQLWPCNLSKQQQLSRSRAYKSLLKIWSRPKSGAQLKAGSLTSPALVSSSCKLVRCGTLYKLSKLSAPFRWSSVRQGRCCRADRSRLRSHSVPR